MSSLAPNPITSRKAEVFQRARTRIVRTDGALDQEQHLRRRAEAEVSQYEKLLGNVMLAELFPMINQQLSHKMADTISDHINDIVLDNPVIRDFLTEQALDQLKKSTLNNAVKIACDLLLDGMQVTGDAYEDISRGPEEAAVFTQRVYVPPLQLTVSKAVIPPNLSRR